MSPEAALWLAVVLAAIRDARRGDPQARRWLSRRSEDLGTVCALAGLEPGWLVRIAPRLIGTAGDEGASCRAEAAQDGGDGAAALIARLSALRGLAA